MKIAKHKRAEHGYWNSFEFLVATCIFGLMVGLMLLFIKSPGVRHWILAVAFSVAGLFMLLGLLSLIWQISDHFNHSSRRKPQVKSKSSDETPDA
jgi:uncharacterized membrane protein